MQIKTMLVKNLTAAPYNPRKITERARAGLSASLAKFGLVDPPIWNERTKHIVGGHQRLEILRERGVEEVDVVVVDLDERDEKALNVALNSPAIAGEWDLPKLEVVLDELRDLPEFDSLLFSELRPPQLDGLENSNEVEELEQVVSKPGDLWTLGRHRLLCGDSTNDEDVKRLLSLGRPLVMVTDPPYSVSYDPAWREGHAWGIGKRCTGKINNDETIDWSPVWRLWDVQVMYVWHAGKYAADVAISLMLCGYEVISQIIWAKQHFVISRGDYHWQHESCWYAVKKGKNHNWQGARDQATLWQIANNNCMGGQGEEKFGHGTQKPIKLMSCPILNNSAKGDIIADPFLGTGTTMIACEQLDRICLAAEIAPAYCDMAIRRWQRFTKKDAIDVEGKSFVERQEC